MKTFHELTSSGTMPLFLLVVVAHLLVDFVLQAPEDARGQHFRKWLRIRHALFHAIVTYTIMVVVAWRAWSAAWTFALAIFLAHVVIAPLKSLVHSALSKLKPDDRTVARWRLETLVLGQSLHLVILWMIVVYLPVLPLVPPTVNEADSWVGQDASVCLVLATGALVAAFVGAEIVGILVGPLYRQVEEARKREPNSPGEIGILDTQQRPIPAAGPTTGLKYGGWYLGVMERTLIFLLVLIEAPAAIGFLIAAKSIFRFGELKEHQHRMEAEYIAIGTLMSFAWGLGTACATQATVVLLTSP